MKFRVKKNPPGLTPHPVAPHQHTDGHWYDPGEVLESPHDLRVMFPSKFERVRDNLKVTEKKVAPVEQFAPPDEDDDEDLMIHEESPTEPAKIPKPGQQLAITKIPKPGSEEKEPAQVKKPAGSGREPSPGEGDGPMRAKGEEKAVEGDDVTDKFPLAKQGDLTVLHNKDGYTVKDGSRVLSKEPLTSVSKVKDFLKEVVEDEEAAAK